MSLMSTPLRPRRLSKASSSRPGVALLADCSELFEGGIGIGDAEALATSGELPYKIDPL